MKATKDAEQEKQQKSSLRNLFSKWEEEEDDSEEEQHQILHMHTSPGGNQRVSPKPTSRMGHKAQPSDSLHVPKTQPTDSLPFIKPQVTKKMLIKKLDKILELAEQNFAPKKEFNEISSKMWRLENLMQTSTSAKLADTAQMKSELQQSIERISNIRDEFQRALIRSQQEVDKFKKRMSDQQI